MITYRDCAVELSLRQQLDRLAQLTRSGDVEGLLVEAGELEQAVLDAPNGSSDTWGPAAAMMDVLARRSAEAFLARRSIDGIRKALDGFPLLLDEISRADLPETLRIKAPEGYLHYALDPAAYGAAARAYVSDAGAERARRAVVVGIRSIGTSLSAVVAAATGSERRVTVRPGGKSGERHVVADGSLSRRLSEWLADDPDVLVVDEGPGATGETLYCVCQWLERLGARDERIALFPSHTGGMSLAPPERRTWFESVRKYAPPDDTRLAEVAAAYDLSEPEDLSWGRWRGALPGTADLPACAHHERTKGRAWDDYGQAYVIRYAGLGRWGEEAAHRAFLLSGLGAGPEVVGFSRGFLVSRWVEGVPIEERDVHAPEWQRALEGYLAARAGLFATGRAVNRAPLVEALIENASERSGAHATGVKAAVRRLVELPDREAFIPDARLHRKEWVRTGTGYMKVDAIDHGNGTRLPGPTDAAWDLAGAAIEYGLQDPLLSALLERIEPDSGRRAVLAAAVQAYRPVYAAASLGEADLNARETGDEYLRNLFKREADRYGAALGHELERLA